MSSNTHSLLSLILYFCAKVQSLILFSTVPYGGTPTSIAVPGAFGMSSTIHPGPVDFSPPRQYFAGIMASTEKAREQILAIGRILAEQQMVAGTDGNISVRCDSGRILITPTGCRLGDLIAADLVLVDLEGTVLEGQLKPSSEMNAHLHLYRRRPNIGAVVHAHPPHATAYAVAGVPLEWEAIPELVALVGPVALTEYAAPGTGQAALALEEFAADHHAFLLRNHGLITAGETLEQAWQRHEVVEHTAKILLLSQLLGGPKKIPSDDLTRLHELRRSLERTLTSQ
jgi:L-fuculose-phosphate aldolase